MATPGKWTEAGGASALGGPGARLRAKRENMGLSMEQVADKLRLDVRYIQALEQDNHADIAAPVFVRGYLRSYAALLQLPADAIVECYAAGDEDTAALFEGPAQPQSKQGINARELRWLIWVAGAAVVIAVAVFLGGRMQSLFNAEPATPLASSSSPRAAAAAGEPLEQASRPDAVTAEPAAPADATHKVMLSLSADSWVVISDAYDKELVYELMRAGSTRVIEGTPPLQVVLGNASAVTVEYNGVKFDHSRFSSGGVARFTLGTGAR